ncbi:MAG: Rieske 2Fe-2S domain-containing protein [Thermomicrobiales bacterium]|nr:Rieske 2Fe-2S domain-containing protein [Thermomicrobiales bacterium]
MPEHHVGSEADFPPGAHRVVKVRNIEIGVFNVAGTFYALPNVCTHQFGPLCEGEVNGTTACNAATGWKFTWVREGEIITCPWHGLEFDITTGQCLAQPKVRLRQYPVTVEDGEVKVIL